MLDLSSLYLKCEKILRNLIHDEESQMAFGPMLVMAESAFSIGDSKFLERLLKEITCIARDFPNFVSPDLLEGEESGREIESIVTAALKRGRIAGNDDVEAISEYIDLIFQDPKMAPLVQKLEGYICEFKAQQAEGGGDSEK